MADGVSDEYTLRLNRVTGRRGKHLYITCALSLPMAFMAAHAYFAVVGLRLGHSVHSFICCVIFGLETLKSRNDSASTGMGLAFVKKQV